MKQLAGFPNVHCKVSSLATEADHRNWTIEDLKPYVEHVFECFGMERTFFGGDWPVSTLAADYEVCVQTVQGFLSGTSAAQLRAFFADNAIAFYRLLPVSVGHAEQLSRAAPIQIS
jgi:L-fuconolactonase